MAVNPVGAALMVVALAWALLELVPPLFAAATT